MLPDEEVATETVDPVVEAATDPAPEPVVAPEPPRKDHWALKRISEESEKARQAQERAAAAERRAAEAEALAERLRATTTPSSTPAPVAPHQTGDRQAEIRAEAARQRYLEDIGEVRSKAIAELGGHGFGEMLNVLNATGVNDDFLADVLAVDKSNAHLLLDKIAKDPERAVSLAAMNSRQRMAELFRMASSSDKGNPPAPSSALAPPRRVSAAPTPAPRVTASAVPPAKDGYADDATDAEFDAQFRERWDKRRARR
jgi:hypothetical protein